MVAVRQAYTSVHVAANIRSVVKHTCKISLSKVDKSKRIKSFLQGRLYLSNCYVLYYRYSDVRNFSRKETAINRELLSDGADQRRKDSNL